MRFYVMLSCVVSFCIIAPVTYMALDNTPPYEYALGDSYVLPSKTPTGTQLLVHWHFAKVNRFCPGFTTRIIVDQKSGAKIEYESTPVSRDVENNHLDRTFFLPPMMNPGPKIYRVKLEFYCNPLQRIWPLRLQTPDLPFEVTDQ